MRSNAWLAVLVIACAPVLRGCRSAVPEQVLARAPVPVGAAPAALSGPWSYRPAAARLAYVVEQRAQLTILQDTSARMDSVSSHAEVAFTISFPTSRVNGMVNVFRVESPGRPAAVPSALGLPFPFAAAFRESGQQLTFFAPSAAPCVAPALAVAHSLRDLWFQPPDTLRLGTAWQDSASYATCRDGVPLRARVRREFRVTAAEERSGRLILSVVRVSYSAFDGEGAQSGEPVTVSGIGRGELTYALDPAGGGLIAALGSSTVELSLRSKVRAQTVRQVGELRISRVP